jgi:hypothetical protein
MSGGSYDYICFSIDEFGRGIRDQDNNPLRKCFAELVRDVAAVAKEIEWADSCDTSQADAEMAMRVLFNKWKMSNNNDYREGRLR